MPWPQKSVEATHSVTPSGLCPPPATTPPANSIRAAGRVLLAFSCWWVLQLAGALLTLLLLTPYLSDGFLPFHLLLLIWSFFVHLPSSDWSNSELQSLRVSWFVTSGSAWILNTNERF